MTVPELNPRIPYTIEGIGHPGQKWQVTSVAHGNVVFTSPADPRMILLLSRLRDIGPGQIRYHPEP